jgi:hypothetical protein
MIGFDLHCETSFLQTQKYCMKLDKIISISKYNVPPVRKFCHAAFKSIPESDILKCEVAMNMTRDCSGAPGEHLKLTVNGCGDGDMI